ncbi:MAG: hypothetical protein Q9174_001482 [Haloplaca sp. 1 TL-2023]
MSTSNPHPSASLPPLTLIVATTPSLGIGLNGSLPWPPLKADLQFFARVTKRLPPSTNPTSEARDGETPIRNAVIMGRKTFDSIPQKFRPLKERTNVVITRSPSNLSSENASENKDVIATSSTVDALQQLQSQHKVGRVFVIGGAEIYRQAIELPECTRVLWTRLDREWECDTWFPKGIIGDGVKEGTSNEHGWRRRSSRELEEWIGEEGIGGIRSEGDIKFEISMWEREKVV